MSWNPFQTYNRDLLKAWIAANTPRIILTNGSTYTNGSSVLEVLSQEVEEGNGYSRQLFNPADGAWDATQNRWEFAAVVASYIVPIDGNLQYDRVAILGGVKSYANKLVSNINTATNRLEFGTAHSFVNGDRVTVTADAGGAVPTALLSSGNPTTLFVVSSQAQNIQVSATSGGAALSLSGGSSPVRVRSIDGSLGFFSNTESITFLAGQTRSIRVTYNIAGNGVDVEAT